MYWQPFSGILSGISHQLESESSLLELFHALQTYPMETRSLAISAALAIAKEDFEGALSATKVLAIRAGAGWRD